MENILKFQEDKCYNINCEYLLSGDLRPWFKSSKDDSGLICSILDPSHMIKLVRNTLADSAVLRNGKGEPIKWEYIEALHRLQVFSFLIFSKCKKINPAVREVPVAN
jgi:hypothetical protein